MFAINRLKDTPEQIVRNAEHIGRNPRRVAGGYVLDLAALGKAIQLCSFCARKFDHRGHGYAPAHRPPFNRGVTADCDGCKNSLVPCTMFVKG